MQTGQVDSIGQEELNYFTELALHETERWIQAVCRKRLPTSDIRQALEDGVYLCQLLNCLRESSVPDYIARPGNYQQRQFNIAAFLKTLRYPPFRLTDQQIFHVNDLQYSTRLDSDHFVKESDDRLRNVALTIHWLGRSVQSWFIGPQIDTSAFVDLITYHSIQPPPSQSPSALSQAPMQPPAPAASRVEMRHNRGPSSSNNGYGDQLGGRGHDPPSATPVDSSAGYKNYNNMEDSYHDFDRKNAGDLGEVTASFKNIASYFENFATVDKCSASSVADSASSSNHRRPRHASTVDSTYTSGASSSRSESPSNDYRQALKTRPTSGTSDTSVILNERVSPLRCFNAETAGNERSLSPPRDHKKSLSHDSGHGSFHRAGNSFDSTNEFQYQPVKVCANGFSSELTTLIRDNDATADPGGQTMTSGKKSSHSSSQPGGHCFDRLGFPTAAVDAEIRTRRVQSSPIPSSTVPAAIRITDNPLRSQSVEETQARRMCRRDREEGDGSEEEDVEAKAAREAYDNFRFGSGGGSSKQINPKSLYRSNSQVVCKSSSERPLQFIGVSGNNKLKESANKVIKAMQEQKEAILEQEKAQRTQGTYQKKKPIMRSKSTFDDEPDWQLNLTSWKSKMRTKSLHLQKSPENTNKDNEDDRIRKLSTKTFKQIAAERAQRIDEDDTKPFFGQSLSNEDDVFAKPWDIKPIRSLHLAKPQSSKVGEAVGSSVKETSQSDTDATFAHKTRKLTKIEIDSSQAKEVAKERDTPSVVRERNAMNHFDIKGHDLDIKGHDLDDTDTSYAGAESCPFNRGKPDNGEDTEYGHLYDYSRTQPCPALPLSPPPPAAPPAEERKPELPPRVPRTANSKCRQRSSSFMNRSRDRKCKVCDSSFNDGTAMFIEDLNMYVHNECFRCDSCLMNFCTDLDTTIVRVKDNNLCCKRCFDCC